MITRLLHRAARWFYQRFATDPDAPYPVWGWVAWVVFVLALVLLLLPRPDAWSEAPPW